MFQAQHLVFYSCTSPVHMGAGTAVGAIDNPIQRETHTGHPLLAGSGLKGAARHHLSRAWADAGEEGRSLITKLFGPERNASDHAGAVAFTDAQLVAFPVRSLRHTFVYATCPTALARLKRMAGSATVATWPIPEPQGDQALMSDLGAASNGRLVLEAFEFDAKADARVKQVAEWLAQHVFPSADAHQFFRAKLAVDLVILSDESFAHFARHATVVEAHVCIDDETGTAKKGGLFYTENLPPESLMAGLVLATVERSKSGKPDKTGRAGNEQALLNADAVLAAVLTGTSSLPGLSKGLLQVGGDATTGRGLITVNAVAGGQ